MAISVPTCFGFTSRKEQHAWIASGALEMEGLGCAGPGSFVEPKCHAILGLAARPRQGAAWLT